MQVRLPSGQVANFPDDMPREQIKAFIGWKFPDAGVEANPADLLKAQIRLQNTKLEATEAPAPRVEGNPAASSLPGPLGDFQNMSSAFQQGAIEGMTGNMSNELASAVIAPFDAAGRAVQGQGFDVGRSFNDIYAAGNERAENLEALNPAAAGRGHITGSLILGKSLGGLSPMARGTTPLRMAGLGALEGGVYGGVYGLGEAEGDLADRAIAAAPQAAVGALTGGAIGYGAGKLMEPVSEEARLINRALQADRIDPNSVNARIAAIDPSAATLADLGPNMQGQAAAIATIPGPGSRTIVDALTTRRAGANDRIRNSVDDALGPPVSLSQVTSDIDAQRRAINTKYEPVLAAKAASSNPLVDIQPTFQKVTQRIADLPNGETKSAYQDVLRRLSGPDGKPISDPRMILTVRQDLDGLIGAETNRTIKSALVDVRRELDQTLGSSVPGLKDIDAEFAEVARQGEAVETGRNILGTDKNAIDPADLIEQMRNASTGQNLRLSQGARAEINRIIGTKANDRVALQGIVRGDGSWNEQKLRAVFGDESANKLMAIVDREATMAATENLATSGSRTQVLRAGQDDFANQTDRGIVREALNFQYGNAAARVADALLGGTIAARREGITNNVARALMARELDPVLQRQMARIQFGLPPAQRDILSALQAAQGAQQ